MRKKEKKLTNKVKYKKSRSLLEFGFYKKKSININEERRDDHFIK
jgi:hypothetical protein